MYKPLKAFYESKGYEVYAEVGKCDTVAINASDGEIIAIEMKLGLNFKVFEQAYRHIGAAHKVYVCVPAPPANNRSKNNFACKVLKDYGIGVIYVGETFYSTIEAVEVQPAATFPLNSKRKPLSDYVGESNALATGGAKSGDTLTAYKLSIQKIYSYLEVNHWSTAKEIAAHVSTHWANPVQSIRNELRMGYNANKFQWRKRGREIVFDIKEG